MRLTAEQVRQFEEQHFVVVRGLIPREVALRCRDEVVWPALTAETGARPDAGETWPAPEQRVVTGEDGSDRVWQRGRCLRNQMNYTPADGELWEQALHDGVHEVLDQLLGVGRWVEDSLTAGWWMVSFPEKIEAVDETGGDDRKEAAAEEEDGEEDDGSLVAGSWHLDGFHKHYPYSLQTALSLLMLFSDVEGDGCGGTAVAVDSAPRVLRLMAEAGHKGLTGYEAATKLQEQYGPIAPESIVQFSGQAGDVAIMSPMVVHARTRNREGTPDAIRFLAHPCIRLKEDMDLARAEPADCSVLERSILRMVGRWAEQGVDLRLLTPAEVADANSRDNTNTNTNTTTDNNNRALDESKRR